MILEICLFISTLESNLYWYVFKAFKDKLILYNNQNYSLFAILNCDIEII